MRCRSTSPPRQSSTWVRGCAWPLGRGRPSLERSAEVRRRVSPDAFRSQDSGKPQLGAGVVRAPAKDRGSWSGREPGTRRVEGTALSLPSSGRPVRSKPTVSAMQPSCNPSTQDLEGRSQEPRGHGSCWPNQQHAASHARHGLRQGGLSGRYASHLLPTEIPRAGPRTRLHAPLAGDLSPDWGAGETFPEALHLASCSPLTPPRPCVSSLPSTRAPRANTRVAVL